MKTLTITVVWADVAPALKPEETREAIQKIYNSEDIPVMVDISDEVNLVIIIMLLKPVSDMIIEFCAEVLFHAEVLKSDTKVMVTSDDMSPAVLRNSLVEYMHPLLVTTLHARSAKSARAMAALLFEDVNDYKEVVYKYADGSPKTIKDFDSAGRIVNIEVRR